MVMGLVVDGNGLSSELFLSSLGLPYIDDQRFWIIIPSVEHCETKELKPRSDALPGALDSCHVSWHQCLWGSQVGKPPYLHISPYISLYLHHEDIDVRYFSWIIRFCLNMPQRDRLQSQSPTSAAHLPPSAPLFAGRRTRTRATRSSGPKSWDVMA